MSKHDPTLFRVRESDLPHAYRKHNETVDGRRTHHWWSRDEYRKIAAHMIKLESKNGQ